MFNVGSIFSVEKEDCGQKLYKIDLLIDKISERESVTIMTDCQLTGK